MEEAIVSSDFIRVAKALALKPIGLAGDSMSNADFCKIEPTSSRTGVAFEQRSVHGTFDSTEQS